MKIRIVLIAAFALAFGCASAWAQQPSANEFYAGPASGPAAPAKFRPMVPADMPPGTISSVANLTALQASCTASSGCPGGDAVFTGGVWRLTYGNGNGAEPLFYAPQNSACSIKAGLGDNGYQVKSADNKCWVAQFPASGASILQFGALGDNSTDNTAIVQNAVNDLPGNGYQIIAPNGVYCLSTGPVIVGTSAPFSAHILGYGNQQTVFSACNNDVTLFEIEGSYGLLQDVSLACRGSFAADTMFIGTTLVITKPCLRLHGGGQNKIQRLVITGGNFTILCDSGCNSAVFDTISAYNAYGIANIEMAGQATLRSSTIDQSWPGTPLTSGNATFNAWASGQSYAANTTVTVTVGGVGFYEQCMNCNGTLTSSGSAPTPKPYNATSNNGTDSLNWRLVAPVTYQGFDCAASCGPMFISDTDFAGPYTHNIIMDGGVSLSANNITTSFNVTDPIFISAGSIQLTNANVSGAAVSSATMLHFITGWTGTANVSNSVFVGNGFGAIIGNSLSQRIVITSNIFLVGVGPCFLTGTSDSEYTFNDNSCVGGSGTITIGSSNTYGQVVNNIISGGSVTNGSGAGTGMNVGGNF